MASIDLTKLQPGKTYNVAVRAKDDAGNYSGYSVNYKFTAPIANLDGSQLTSINSTVVTSLSAGSNGGGAVVVGSLDSTGIKTSGNLNLLDVWNSTYNTNSGYLNLTGSIGGAVIINSKGILGYNITSNNVSGSSTGKAQFLLDNTSGNAYFNGTIFSTSSYSGGGTIGQLYTSVTNNQALSGSAYATAASALLTANTASTNTLNYLGLPNTGISGSALISSANTITNASNQMTAISTNGITISTASGTSASSASGASRVILNSIGFAAYDASGSPTVTITASTGTAMFTGSVIATYGKFGGFTLDTTKFYAGVSGSQNFTGMIPGTASAFFAGANDNLGTNALFRVSNDGLLYAQNAVITGAITASAGVIGNWNIGLQSLWAGNTGSTNFTGMIPGTASAFFAGATASTGAGAQFRVQNDGYLYANNATIYGTVYANSGQIGGWNIGASALTAGAGASAVGLNTTGYPFYAGSTIASSAPFYVTSTGTLNATNASITGYINSGSGNIGGWNINPSTLSGSSTTTNLIQAYDPSFENQSKYGKYWDTAIYSPAAGTPYALQLINLKNPYTGRYYLSTIYGFDTTLDSANASTMFTMFLKSASAGTRFLMTDLGLVTGSSYVFSAYVKLSDLPGYTNNATTATIYVGQYAGNSNVGPGVAGQSGAPAPVSVSSSTVTLTASWQRVSASFVAGSSSLSVMPFIGMNNPVDGSSIKTLSMVDIDAVQLESGTTPTAYNVGNYISLSSGSNSLSTGFSSSITNLSITNSGNVQAESVSSGVIFGSNIPFGVSTGMAIFTSQSVAAGSFITKTLYFPEGRFSTTPVVFTNIMSGGTNMGYFIPRAVSTNVFSTTVRIYNVSASTLTMTNASVSILAVQQETAATVADTMQ